MISSDFSTEGYAIVPDLVSAAEVAVLQRACERVTVDGRAGARNLLAAVPEVREIVRRDGIAGIVTHLLGPKAFAVRAVLFDKTVETNWQILWHQDATVAVAQERETPGFYGWSQKDGVPHVHPPAEILEGMVAARIHLDDCDLANGPLSVLPGSHLQGRMTAETVLEWRESHMAQTCLVAAGGVMMMRPLLLHHSAAATNPRRRRVIHVEFAQRDLPQGLEWHERVA